ncbi:unnamed protein product [Lota lota]
MLMRIKPRAVSCQFPLPQRTTLRCDRDLIQRDPEGFLTSESDKSKTRDAPTLVAPEDFLVGTSGKVSQTLFPVSPAHGGQALKCTCTCTDRLRARQRHADPRLSGVMEDDHRGAVLAWMLYFLPLRTAE